MVYKKYYIHIVVRICLLLANCILFAFAIVRSNYIYTITFLGIAIALQAYYLIKYINKVNIFLERFLNYIKESNTSLNISQSIENTTFKGLSEYFLEINNIIKEAKIDKEKHYLFLQYIFNHANIGLIAFDSTLKVQLINQASKTLLGINALENINLLAHIDKNIPKLILSLLPGQQKVIPVAVKGRNIQLSIKFSKFKLMGKEISLISLQDIKPELDHKEIDSWQKLNRVLTHEIMNSVSPIIGLTNNISKLLKSGSGIKKINEIDNHVLEQTVQSVNIIEERSNGLNKFVQKFRNITTQVKPEPQHIDVHELLESLSLFMHDIIHSNHIEFGHEITPKDFSIYADKKLIEQVIINLIKNSVEALENRDNKKIKIHAFIDENGQKAIQVIDNGKGIPADKLDLIFTPFYTSKNKGSGIGLSLSKNIIKQHGYNIDVSSTPGVETIFTLYF